MRWQDIKLVNSTWKEVTVIPVKDNSGVYELKDGKLVRVDQPKPSDKEIETA